MAKKTSVGTSTKSGMKRATISKKDREFLKERIVQQFESPPSKAKTGKKSGKIGEPLEQPSSTPLIGGESEQEAQTKSKQSHGQSSAQDTKKPPKEKSLVSTALDEGVNIFGEQHPIGQLPEGLPPEFKPLNAQQRLFVVYYAVTRNGVEAVKMAGYVGTYESMQTQAWRLLRNVDILKAYDAYMRPEFEKQGITVARTLQHLADVAFSPWSEHLIVKEKKGRIVAVHMQMSSKIKALEIITKMLRLTTDKEIDIQQFIDQSQNIHVHAKTPDDARKALLDYLRKRK